MRSRPGLLATLVVALLPALCAPAAAQSGAGPAGAADADAAPAVSFRSSVDLVSIAAVVRDRRGKPIPGMTGQEFEVYDAGERRRVLAFHSDRTAPASVAILVDGSGSMVLGAAHHHARRISTGVLASLTPERDTAALLSFDTRLLTLCDFTRDFSQIRSGLLSIEAFGSTSLYDAIAGSAGLVADRAQNRRAVIVITDGADTTSAYPPAQVAWMASTIDVPIYVFAVGDGPVVRLGAVEQQPLADIARSTGGDFFVANTPELIEAAVKRVTDELRHQYVFAFESAAAGGLRRLEVRTRRRNVTVTARRWYRAGADD